MLTFPIETMVYFPPDLNLKKVNEIRLSSVTNGFRSSDKYFVLQFAVLMWLLTYVGALFNGLTLLLMGKDR